LLEELVIPPLKAVVTRKRDHPLHPIGAIEAIILEWFSQLGEAESSVRPGGLRRNVVELLQGWSNDDDLDQIFSGR
jgi:hypothetical protein